MILNVNTALICIEFIIIAFSIYLVRMYYSSKSEKPRSQDPKKSNQTLNRGTIMFLIIMCICYILILSWFIKIPSFKPYYLYSCFPVRIVPIPKQNEPRCADIVVFNLTRELTENYVVNVKPSSAYEKMVFIGHDQSINSPCLFQKNTIFLYYCMEYGTTTNSLYYIMVKNTLA